MCVVGVQGGVLAGAVGEVRDRGAVVAGAGSAMSSLRHGPPLALHGYLDKEGRKLHGRKTRYFKLQDSALFNHRRKVRLWEGCGGEAVATGGGGGGPWGAVGRGFCSPGGCGVCG